MKTMKKKKDELKDPQNSSGENQAQGELIFHEFWDQIPIGLYRISLDGEIMDVNQALVEMFGYPDADAVKKVNAADLYVNKMTG